MSPMRKSAFHIGAWIIMFFAMLISMVYCVWCNADTSGTLSSIGFMLSYCVLMKKLDNWSETYGS